MLVLMDSHVKYPTFSVLLTTVLLDAFQVGVSTFGLPDRVRSDHGGENIDVWRYMLDTHSGDPQCVLTGSSTHNERIERLWRDVHRCLIHFADTF